MRHVIQSNKFKQFWHDVILTDSRKEINDQEVDELSGFSMTRERKHKRKRSNSKGYDSSRSMAKNVNEITR